MKIKYNDNKVPSMTLLKKSVEGILQRNTHIIIDMATLCHWIRFCPLEEHCSRHIDQSESIDTLIYFKGHVMYIYYVIFLILCWCLSFAPKCINDIVPKKQRQILQKLPWLLKIQNDNDTLSEICPWQWRQKWLRKMALNEKHMLRKCGEYFKWHIGIHVLTFISKHLKDRKQLRVELARHWQEFQERM